MRPQPEAGQFGPSTGKTAVDYSEEMMHIRKDMGGIKTAWRDTEKGAGGIEETMEDTQKDIGDIRRDIKDTKQKLEGIDARLESIELRFHTHLAANDNNNIARMQNYSADRADSRIRPLYAISTNEKIENFPKTVGDIDQLDAAQLDVIIYLLGHPRPDHITQKRLKLKKLAGIFYAEI
ncbi:hypothetical protein F5Y14DRAFT_421008 [Nemania sp. NC0429]|nr:hypothetical protein F5Y14DRAFT_421008 [Nemania sp. NC0429]